MVRSEVMKKVLKKYFELVFQICRLSPFPTTTTWVQASWSRSCSSNQPHPCPPLSPSCYSTCCRGCKIPRFLSPAVPCRDSMVALCVFLPSAWYMWGMSFVVVIFPTLPKLPSASGTLLLLFSSWVVSNSVQPHGLQHTQLPCSSLSPGVCSNSYPLHLEHRVTFIPRQTLCLECHFLLPVCSISASSFKRVQEVPAQYLSCTSVQILIYFHAASLG